MDGDENTNNTPNNDTPAPPATNGDAPANDAPPVTPPVVEPPAAPVVPDGYVKAEDVETERTARTAAETARTEAETRATQAEARARAAEIKAVAQTLGFNDPSDAEKFVAADVTDIEGALASVIESKPYLKKASEAVTPPVTPTNPTNPARPEALTLDSIKTMTPAQINARWSDVKQALARK
jgi:hypothetical protein